MPMIDVTSVRGSLDDEALTRLTDELVTVLLRAERAPVRWIRANSPWAAGGQAQPGSGST
jgi:phenylpyruvate tautomerase PptA (4-oxalocrotonate tautomerase family)